MTPVGVHYSVTHRESDHAVQNQGRHDQKDQQVEKLEGVRCHALDRTGEPRSVSDQSVPSER